MKKLTFKNKVYLLFSLLIILSLIADFFDILELNSYSGLMAILFLTILVRGIQYYAAKKGLDVMLSIDREYGVRKLWNTENKFDWEEVRKKQLNWAPVIIGVSLLKVVVLYFTGNRYSMVLIIIWATTTMLYTIYTRPLKYKTGD